MQINILLSGFGGQGIMSLGKIIAKAAAQVGYFTSWFPSYGSEVRGGTAHCFVKISQEPIASPLIDDCDIGIFLNQPSLDKFDKKLKKRGVLIVNKDMSEYKSERKDLKVIDVPLNILSLNCGNIKVANTVVLGILAYLWPNIFSKDKIIEILKETFLNPEIIKQNINAFIEGLKYGEENLKAISIG